jgi:hypothetical protein
LKNNILRGFCGEKSWLAGEAILKSAENALDLHQSVRVLGSALGECFS